MLKKKKKIKENGWWSGKKKKKKRQLENYQIKDFEKLNENNLCNKGEKNKRPNKDK